MTAQEHQKAEKSLLDDDTMSTIIKNARFIPLEEEQRRDVARQVARLQVPQQLFGRVGRGLGDVDDPDQDLIFPTESPKRKGKRKVGGGGNSRDESPTPTPTKRSRTGLGGVSFAADEMQMDAAESSNRLNESILVESAFPRRPNPQDPAPAIPAYTSFPRTRLNFPPDPQDRDTPNPSHPTPPRRRAISALTPQQTDSPTPTTRRVGFALPSQEPEDTSTPTTNPAPSSSSSTRRVGFALPHPQGSVDTTNSTNSAARGVAFASPSTDDEQPRRSLFGGPSRNA